MNTQDKPLGLWFHFLTAATICLYVAIIGMLVDRWPAVGAITLVAVAIQIAVFGFLRTKA